MQRYNIVWERLQNLVFIVDVVGIGNAVASDRSGAKIADYSSGTHGTIVYVKIYIVVVVIVVSTSTVCTSTTAAAAATTATTAA